MTIERALQNQGWQFKDTGKWTSVEDLRPEFKKAFSTNRVGKIIGSKFYITLSDLSVTAHQLIMGLGQSVESVVSTSGRGDKYPGFECSHVVPTLLLAFAEQLRLEVDGQMQKKLDGNSI
jgi:hypothetical protein